LESGKRKSGGKEIGGIRGREVTKSDKEEAEEIKEARDQGGQRSRRPEIGRQESRMKEIGDQKMKKWQRVEGVGDSVRTKYTSGDPKKNRPLSGV